MDGGSDEIDLLDAAASSLDMRAQNVLFLSLLSSLGCVEPFQPAIDIGSHSHTISDE